MSLEKYIFFGIIVALGVIDYFVKAKLHRKRVAEIKDLGKIMWKKQNKFLSEKNLNYTFPPPKAPLDPEPALIKNQDL